MHRRGQSSEHILAAQWVHELWMAIRCPGCFSHLSSWLEMEPRSRLGQIADGMHTLLKFLDWLETLLAHLMTFNLGQHVPFSAENCCWSTLPMSCAGPPSIAVPLPTHNPAYPHTLPRAPWIFQGRTCPHKHTQDWIQHPCVLAA